MTSSTSATSHPETLHHRSKALEAAIRDLVVDYKDYTDALCQYELHLDGKIATLGKLADELGGVQPEPSEYTRDMLDDEIPF